MLNFDYPINRNFDFYTGSDALDSPALLRSYDEIEFSIKEVLGNAPVVFYGFKHFEPKNTEQSMDANIREFIDNAYFMDQNYDNFISAIMYHLVLIFPAFVPNEFILSKPLLDKIIDIIGVKCMNFNILYIVSPYNGRPILHVYIPNIAYKHYKHSNRLFSKSRRARVENINDDIVGYLTGCCT